jgi:hypothetical protein
VTAEDLLSGDVARDWKPNTIRNHRERLKTRL